MIVKNEITRLGRCIGPIKGLVDEIVIADTGSDDGTQDLVNKLAHKPLKYHWDDDFSAARNYALDHATGDWVIFLDADEYIRPFSRQSLETALLRQNVIAYRVQVCNQLDKGLSGNEFMVRLFRRLPMVRYSGRIHEQVTPAIARLMAAEPGWSAEILSGFVIDHEGYNPGKSDQAPKNARNIRLLKMVLEESPDDPYILYKLSKTLGHLPEGREHLFKSANLILSHTPEQIKMFAFAPELLTNAAIEWTNADNTDKALHACGVAVACFPDHPSTRLAQGIAYMKAGHPDKARIELEKALHMPPPVNGFYYDKDAHQITAYLSLANIFMQTKSYDRAVQVLHKARRSYPADESILINLLKTLLDDKQPGEVLKEGLSWLKNNPSPQCLLLCADAAEMTGDKELAKQWRSRLTD